MQKTKKMILPIAMLLALTLLFSSVGAPTISAVDSAVHGLGDAPYINLVEGLDINEADFFASSAVQKLPEGISDDEIVSLIIRTESKTLLDAFNSKERDTTFGEFLATEEAAAVRLELEEQKEALLERLDDACVIYDEGDSYDSLLAGFEITAKAKFFDKIKDALGADAKLILGDVYNVSETKYVENKVDVYETGIFNSSEFPCDGTGMVIAVLDTGLDYYHSAFSNFKVEESKLGLTFDDIKNLMSSSDMAAERIKAGLSANDVFVSNKVPFAFDYADYDSDVYPLRSDHGTHVSGIIAGKDDTITGVAPSAQLVEMKIFSDVMDTARSSWILSALEDCVKLGVDVINLSIGTSCGFSTESEKEQMSGVYDAIRNAGISLIVAASNSYSSAYGSEKNGNLGLTSNPDSGTIGSPATYAGALSVASVEGEKTAYLLHNGKIVYFNESSDRRGEKKDFVDEFLLSHGDGKTFVEMEYVTVPGVGRSADYKSVDVKGKIALVRRGSNTFEEKANIAEKMGAAGIIIYNNVSGEIVMNVGTVSIPACSISQDDGEMLAASSSGVIRIDVKQAAGPFISEFSSWGPSPSLELKPEVTAHGGSILSSVPGQDYDRISGTSMATPNVSGLVALLRQYLINRSPELADDPTELTARINRLLMSTADVLYSKNGLAYSPRKQGAGLTNLKSAANTGAYILTYDRLDGSVMDKSKIELGDDPAKTGVYTLKFSVDNFGDKALSYDVSTYIMTEGVSTTKTDRGETTVSQEGYLLEGAGIVITSLGGGSLNGNTLTVAAGECATVSIKITLTDENKKYLDESFKNGMYVEGFVTLDAKDEETVDLSVPYLAFYGDWTKAPLFDIDYYQTNKDELNDALDPVDKTLPDAYATRPIGGISGDYVGYLGSYYYEQEPGSKKIAADRKYVSLSNQEDAINSLRFVWAGLLRGAKKIDITITEDSTGLVVYKTTDDYVRKSYSDGGMSIYPANIDIDFSAVEHNLKNNTSYTVTLKGYLDYGDGGEGTNLNNTFSFPLVTDFSAPIVSGCEFYTEYDRSAKKNRLYAKIAIYDNHYSMAACLGYAGMGTDGAGNAQATFFNFDQYFNQIYSDYNSTSYLIYELTDHIDEIKSGATNKNTFAIALYDYALNTSMYEIALPAEYTDLYFETADCKDVVQLKLGSSYAISDIYDDLTAGTVASISGSSDVFEITGDSENGFTVTLKTDGVKDERVATLTLRLKNGSSRTLYVRCSQKSENLSPTKMLVLSPNQTYKLEPKVYPTTEWSELLNYSSSKASVAKIVGREILAVGKGVANVRATTADNKKRAEIPVLILGEGDDGYRKYDKPVVKDFVLSGYLTNKAYYFLDTEDRDIGKTGDQRKFVGTNLSLSMYPSESVTLQWSYLPYFPDTTSVVFESSNEDIVSIDQNGKITAIAEGFASVTVRIVMDGKSTYYSKNVSIEVKDPYVSNGPLLMNYYGNGGKVVIPDELCLVEIGQFAFSNYDYVPKGPEDEISEEMPEASKIWYIGDDTIEEIVIPEGVERIGMYAFANLTALKKVTLPSTLKSISNGAFYGCINLTTVEGIENVKFINQEAFANCSLSGELNLKNAVAISDRAFAKFVRGTDPESEEYKNSVIACEKQLLTKVTFGPDTQSIAAFAFSGNESLKDIYIGASKVKLGEYAFANCKNLTSTRINAAVIPEGAFYGCSKLANVVIGKDVELIGAHAFTGTNISTFSVENGNTAFAPATSVPYVLSADETELLLVSPTVEELDLSANKKITRIGNGAFMGNTSLRSVNIPSVKRVGSYAFDGCTSLSEIKLNRTLYEIGDYAFTNTKLDTLPFFVLDNKRIGDYAFAGTQISTVLIPNDVTVGDYAFAYCKNLTSIQIGIGVTVGKYAFYTDIFDPDNREEASITKDGKTYYYYTYKSPITFLYIGENATLLEGAFYGASMLEQVTLGNGAWIGDFAFYHADKLSSIDLSGAVYIGNWAFTGAYDTYYTGHDLNGNLTGNAVNSAGTDYLYIFYTPNFTSVNLSSAKHVGAEAFTYCGYVGELDRGEGGGLTSVTFGSKTDKISDGAFAYCEKLNSISFGSVTEIGNYAFYNTAVTNLSLYFVKTVGEDAFAFCGELKSVTFGTAIERIGNGAFAYCTKLASTSRLGSARYIGDTAFAYTALTSADLTNAEYVGSYAFIKNQPTEFTLILGTSLKELGDNPFTYCVIAPLSKEEEVTLGSTVSKVTVYTFELGENVRIIDGSIYRVVPRGLELVSYFGSDSTVIVADGTVRIAAGAFRGADKLRNVVLPASLKAIGHKAFFDCDALATVIFKSYIAPILEEEFDPDYVTWENIPFYFDYSANEVFGLGIRDYRHLSLFASNFFFGANFKDYIGHIENKLTMIRPINGKNYDTFIFDQYFDLVIDGALAASDVTLEAIEAINKIPERVTLDDKSVIEAARAAYDKIVGVDQIAYATEYLSILEKAEKRIAVLEKPDEPVTPDEPITPDEPVTPDEPDTPVTPPTQVPSQPSTSTKPADDTDAGENDGISTLAIVIIVIVVLTLGAVVISAAVITVSRKNSYRK